MKTQLLMRFLPAIVAGLILSWGCAGGTAGVTGPIGPTSGSQAILPLPPSVPSFSTGDAPVHGTISLGPTQTLTSFNLSGNGGSYTISGTKTSLDGLTFSAAHSALALAPTQGVTITYSAIISTTFPVHPISPLITITTQNVTQATRIELDFPVTTPAGQIVDANYYDPTNQRLVGVPLTYHTAKSIGLDIAFFDIPSASILQARARGRTASAAGTQSVSLLVNTVPQTSLPKVVDSKLRPGIDDCLFPNNGSAVSVSGECAGTSALVAWYFANKKITNGPLGTYLDDFGGGNGKTPSFWQDDSKGYRATSTLQYSFNVLWGDDNSYVSKSVNQYYKLSPTDTFNKIVTSMQSSGQPQILYLVDSEGVNSHAVLVFRVDGQYIYFADPNKVGVMNTGISYDSASGTFRPYGTYTKFYWQPAGHIIADNLVSSDVVALATAGNGVFPTYALPAYDSSDTSVSSDFPAYTAANQQATTVNGTTLTIKPTGSLDIAVYNQFQAGSQPIAVSSRSLPFNVTLKPGSNILGCYIADSNNKYIDFRYLNVNSVASSKIAFNAWTPTNNSAVPSSIYVVNSDGSGLLNIAKGTGLFAGYYSPAVSPDGTRIAFTDGLSALSIENSSGGGRTFVFQAKGTQEYADPAWSPSGQQLAFLWVTNVGSIYTSNTDGSGLVNVTKQLQLYSNPEFPSYSPDGKKIAFFTLPTVGQMNAPRPKGRGIGSVLLEQS